jgi:hypothetical protein
MHKRLLVAAALFAAALALNGSLASASMMHPRLAARLSGMGAHGTVNIEVVRGGICWRFDLPGVAHVTRASIHRGQRGAMRAELGMRYRRSGCEKISAMTLDQLKARPAAFWVWVDTKGHRDDLRGRLHAGTARMM